MKTRPMTSFVDITYSTRDGIAEICIVRQDRLNAFTERTLEELAEAFVTAGDDGEIGVVILGGAGNRAFSVGGEISGEMTEQGNRRFFRRALLLSATMRSLEKPIIAKIRGWCIGGGNELNMLCDLSIAAESARFGQTGPRIGSVPVWYGAQGLLTSVGEKKAREIVYLCRHYTAHEAASMGWINAVVPDEQLDGEVERWAQELLTKSPKSLALAKATLNALTDQLQNSVSLGAEAVQMLHFTPEAQEAMAAFLEKRPPRVRERSAGAIGSRDAVSP